MIIGGKGQCTHARACESVRGPVEEKHRKRVGGKQQCRVLSEQGHPCCEAIQFRGITEKAGLLLRVQLCTKQNTFCVTQT